MMRPWLPCIFFGILRCRCYETIAKSRIITLRPSGLLVLTREHGHQTYIRPAMRFVPRNPEPRHAKAASAPRPARVTEMLSEPVLRRRIRLAELSYLGGRRDS